MEDYSDILNAAETVEGPEPHPHVSSVPPPLPWKPADDIGKVPKTGSKSLASRRKADGQREAAEMIRLVCRCGRRLRVKPEGGDKRVKCPKCAHGLIVRGTVERLEPGSRQPKRERPVAEVEPAPTPRLEPSTQLTDSTPRRPSRALGELGLCALLCLMPGWLVILLWPSSLRAKSAVLGTLVAVCLLSAMLWLDWSPSISARETVVLRGNVASLAIDPGGTTLAVGRTRGVIELWNLQSGELLQQTEAVVGGVSGIEYVADSRTLIFALGSKLQLWKGSLVGELEGHGRAIKSFVLSADRTMAATWSGRREVVFWDLTTCQKQETLKLPGDSFTVLALSPDGRLLAGGTRKGEVVILDRSVTDAEAIIRYSGLKRGAIASVGFSSDGSQLAAATADGRICLWDVVSGKRLAEVRGESGIRRVRFAPGTVGGAKSRRLIVLGARRLRLWDPDGGQSMELPATETEGYDVMAVSADGRLIAVGGNDDSAVWVFELPRGKLLYKLDVAR